MITLTATEGTITRTMPKPRTARARTVPGAAIEALRIMRKWDAHGVVHVGGNSNTWATVTRHDGGIVGIVERYDTRLRSSDKLCTYDEYTMYDLRRILRRERRLQAAERRL